MLPVSYYLLVGEGCPTGGDRRLASRGQLPEAEASRRGCKCRLKSAFVCLEPHSEGELSDLHVGTGLVNGCESDVFPFAPEKHARRQ